MNGVRAACLTLAGLITIGALASCSARPAPPAPVTTTAPPAPAATGHPGPFSGGAVRAPEAGALLGAWVRPRRLSDVERVAAVRGFEEQLGRKLAIVNTYRRLGEDFATSADRRFLKSGATLMVSWAVGDTRSITMGRQDDILRDRARKLRDLGKPVMLRFRWEMDRPNLTPSIWTPQDYVEAWRHTRELFAAEGARNVAWVWCPTVEGFAAGRAGDFYPGDSAVDWICVDTYAGGTLAPFASLMQPFVEWASAHAKPIVVGEFGIGRGWGPQARAEWLRSAFTYVRTVPQIKAVVYFESDPDGRDDKRSFSLSPDPVALAAFAQAATTPYFSPS
ncbi:hypothetical protein F4553_004979 [Allocatelliglobosispora scoriae]|uniref:GH26 domain-containing protein n=1 Tax=Allocatelliglobosispora scoriae TaxID=643052 RepID=A0A841BY02_9ACTN|nr:glycosyl hydrolase [Allocatelliglobosispora scoriae]MBB5871600.1 hypothetical protein [Allocatelliglobosispora scoriae]